MEIHTNQGFKTSNLPDYKDNPSAYELEEQSRPDEMAMIGGVTRLSQQYLDGIQNARVLDLCCGTGLPLLSIVDHKNIDSVVGVDISPAYLDFARNRFKYNSKVSFIEADAIESSLPHDEWDIIIMASAYHHIEDARKLSLMNRVSTLLGSRGYAVIGENVLPPYNLNDLASYQDAVRSFYQEVIKTAEQDGNRLPDDAKSLIERVAQYGVDGEYEYKVSISVLINDIRSAGLIIDYQEKVWPHSGPLCLTTGGNYILGVQNRVFNI